MVTSDNENLLARIDERTQAMERNISQIQDELKRDYVTHAEFNPIRMIVYGMVAVTMVSVLGGLLYLVVRQPPTP